MGRLHIDTARSVRGRIKGYYICASRPVNSQKFGRGKVKGKKLIVNSVDKLLDDFTDEIETK